MCVRICLECTQSCPLINSEKKALIPNSRGIIIGHIDVSKEQSAMDKRCDYMTSTSCVWTHSNAGCRDGLGLDFTVISVDASLTAHHSKSQGQRESSALHNRIANEGLSIRWESVRLTTNRPAMTDEGINQLSFKRGRELSHSHTPCQVCCIQYFH